MDLVKTGRRVRLAMGLTVMLAFGLAHGATVYVANGADDQSFTCLRRAIITANVSGGNNTILLTQKTYLLTQAGADEDAAVTGDLDLTHGTLTIGGVAGQKVTIDASGLGDRVFQVLAGAKLTLTNLIIIGGHSPAGTNSNPVTNGVSGTGENGGAIYNAGTLTLNNCEITGNSCGAGGLGDAAHGVRSGKGGAGGGIYNAGVLAMNACVLSGNRGGTSGEGGNPDDGGSGGGLYNVGNATISGSTVVSNQCGQAPAYPQANGSGNGGNGGGIFNSGTLTITGSTVRDNSGGTGGRSGLFGNSGGLIPHGYPGGMGGHGGGIFNSGNLSLILCTLSRNHAGPGGEGTYAVFSIGGNGGNGGGIYNLGTTTLHSCTLASNIGGTGGNGGVVIHTGYSGGDGGSGGGIFNASSNTAVQIQNTLIALNAPGPGGLYGEAEERWTDYGSGGLAGMSPDLAGDFTSHGFNLIGAGNGSTGLTNGANADLVGSSAAPINPHLGPLQDNGGATFTQALLFGSPAVDQGSSLGLVVDQRGHARPHDYAVIPNSPAGDGCDIGAFEADTPLLALQKSTGNTLISWEANCPGNYTLEYSTNLSSPNGWTPVANPAVLAGPQFQVTDTIKADRKYFRLKSN